MSQAIETPAPIIAQQIPRDTTSTSVAAPPISLPRRDDAAQDSLFNRFAWLYVFFRENLFRDDTERMVDVLWPNGQPPSGTKMIELGCGPGFYSCGFAARFPDLSVLGIDRAPRQLDCAKRKARRLGLTNCSFANDNVLELSHADNSFDLIVAARLFTVLPNRQRAVSEMHRVLKPGGRCLIAEPRYKIWASLPLLAMWLVARVTAMDSSCCEPRRAIVLSADEFADVFTAQPWRDVKVWQDGRYQYALCEKV